MSFLCFEILLNISFFPFVFSADERESDLKSRSLKKTLRHLNTDGRISFRVLQTRCFYNKIVN